MLAPNKSISPGVARLIPKKLQEILWNLFEDNPLLPSVFDLRKGKGRYLQSINHMCLPDYDQWHKVSASNPIDDIRVTILKTDSGQLLMRLSNKKLEAEMSQLPSGPEQGELF